MKKVAARRPRKTSPGIELLALFHYCHPAGSHPTSRRPAAGQMIVELLTGGRGWLDEGGGRWREVGPGDLLWHGPGQPTVGRSDWENPYSCLAAIFAIRGAKTAGMPPRCTHWPDLPAVRQFTDEVAAAFFEAQADRAALTEYVHAVLLYRARRHVRTGKLNILPPQVRAAMDVLDGDTRGLTSIGDLARRVGWSVPHLHAMFRQHLGTAPHHWQLHRRLSRAQERLLATTDPVKRIADDCGFHDAAAFVRAFRRFIGSTPGAYRARHGHGGT